MLCCEAAMNWKELADEAKKKREAGRVQQEKDLSDRKVLEAHWESMWVAIKQATKDAVAKLNEEMKKEKPNFITFHGASNQNRFTLKINTLQTAVEYSPGTWKLSVRGYRYQSTYWLRVVVGNGVVWVDEADEHCTSEQVADGIVERAFKEGELQQ
jgi:hypothetical protein